MYIKTSTAWKKINEAYIKTSVGWKKVTEGYIKTINGWKRFWSSALKPQYSVQIDASTVDPTTYLITLTGTNYYWSPGPPSLTYYFEWSTNGGTTWTQLSTGTATNPAVSNTYDFKILANSNIITPNEANPLHGTPHFELRGKSFKSGVKMSYEDREDLLQNKNKYIGKTAEIRFFEYSENGIPRFPVMVGIRLDK